MKSPMYLTKNEINQLCYHILNCAIEVHKALGAGLLESIYERCMLFELQSRGFKVENQVNVPLIYKGNKLDSDLRLDLIVENTVIVELKTVEKILPIHEAQIMTYLRLLDLPKGIIINFTSTNIMKFGQKTFVTKKFGNLPDGYREESQ